MAYQTVDTQPERTALAWSRSSLALLGGTFWVCRFAFVGQSPFALAVLITCTAIMATNFFLLKSRKRRLRMGVDASTATGIENALVVAQIVILGVAALFE